MAWATVTAPAPVGPLTFGVTALGVVYLAFGGAADGRGRRRLVAAAQRAGGELRVDHAATDPVAAQLAEYLAGARTAFELPIDWSLTTGAQRTVLTALHRTVGYGETVTYGELAARSHAFDDASGQAGGAARGVGSIMGSNPIAVIVPCHRVLAADGLGGFGGGLERKRWLLGLEGVLTPTLDLNL